MTNAERTHLLGRITRAERALCNAGVSVQVHPGDYAIHDGVLRWLDNAELEIAARFAKPSL